MGTVQTIEMGRVGLSRRRFEALHEIRTEHAIHTLEPVEHEEREREYGRMK